MINYYVKDAEGIAAFYCENSGFKETLRTPEGGLAVYIEVKLGAFSLGLADVEASCSMHNLPLKLGLPRGEVAMWTDDVDEVYEILRGESGALALHTTFWKLRHFGPLA